MDIYNSQHTKERTYIQICKSNSTLYNYCNNKHEFSSNEHLPEFDYKEKIKKIDELLFHKQQKQVYILFQLLYNSYFFEFERLPLKRDVYLKLWHYLYLLLAYLTLQLQITF